MNRGNALKAIQQYFFKKFAPNKKTPIFVPPIADMAELVDALDLGSSAFGRGGSTPSIRTTYNPQLSLGVCCLTTVQLLVQLKENASCKSS